MPIFARHGIGAAFALSWDMLRSSGHNGYEYASAIARIVRFSAILINPLFYKDYR